MSNLIICHYGDKNKTIRAVKSVRKFYPKQEILIFNDGTDDTFNDILEIKLSKNFGHGHALDVAKEFNLDNFMFSMDNDAVMVKHGIIEEMESLMDSNSIYAVGRKVGHENYFIHPCFALWNLRLIDNHSFEMTRVLDRRTDTIIELQTAEQLGYHMLFVKGYCGVDVDINNYIKHTPKI